MAKCVACTAINAALESKRHSNPTAEQTARILDKRWNNTPKSAVRRYCSFHSPTGTGRATEAAAIRTIAERKAEAAQNEAHGTHEPSHNQGAEVSAEGAVHD